VQTARIEKQKTGKTDNGENDLLNVTRNIVGEMFGLKIDVPKKEAESKPPASKEDRQMADGSKTFSNRQPSGEMNESKQATHNMLFGVNVGGNRSSISGNLPHPDGSHYNMSSKNGFQAGVTFDYGFTENLYLLTGLEYSRKNTDLVLTSNTGFLYEGGYFSMDCLQLPIHAGYKFNGGAVKIVPQAGPYLAYGLSVPGIFKQLDYGIGVGIGAEYNGFEVKFGYDWGLADVLDMGFGFDSIQTRNLFLTVGYKFKSKK
jgi:hypothetical protein